MTDRTKQTCMLWRLYSSNPISGGVYAQHPLEKLSNCEGITALTAQAIKAASHRDKQATWPRKLTAKELVPTAPHISDMVYLIKCYDRHKSQWRLRPVYGVQVTSALFGLLLFLSDLVTGGGVYRVFPFSGWVFIQSTTHGKFSFLENFALYLPVNASNPR